MSVFLDSSKKILLIMAVSKKILEFESGLSAKMSSKSSFSISSSDVDTINEKYLKGDVRIVTEQARYPLNQIKAMFETESYDKHPEFQRRHRWSDEKKSRLIESFIMNVPVPPIFLYEKDYSQYEVMDGLQRITAIVDFYENRYALSSLEEWPELNGMTYSQLPLQIKRGIDRRYISSVILLKETAKTSMEAQRLKQLVFARINSGGAKLEDQEFRNALYPGAFNEMIICLARNDVFCNIFGLPLKTESENVLKNIVSEELRECKDFSKMKDVENVLRFFALRSINNWSNTTFTKFLDQYSKEMMEVPEDILDEYNLLFCQTIKLANKIFEDKVFCQWKRNKQTEKFEWTRKPVIFIYDAIMQSLSRVLDFSDQLIVKRRQILTDYRLLQEKNEDQFNGRNTSKSSVEGRIDLFNKMLSQYI